MTYLRIVRQAKLILPCAFCCGIHCSHQTLAAMWLWIWDALIWPVLCDYELFIPRVLMVVWLRQSCVVDCSPYKRRGAVNIIHCVSPSTFPVCVCLCVSERERELSVMKWKELENISVGGGMPKLKHVIWVRFYYFLSQWITKTHKYYNQIPVVEWRLDFSQLQNLFFKVYTPVNCLLGLIPVEKWK